MVVFRTEHEQGFSSSLLQRYRVLLIPVELTIISLALYYLSQLWSRTTRPIAEETTGAGKTMLAVVALSVYFVLLMSFDLLTKYESEQGQGLSDGLRTSPLLIVLMVESGKLMLSAVSEGHRQWQHAQEGPLKVPETSWADIREVVLRLLPVAALYSANNVLNLFVLSQMRLDAYVVWRNTAIFFNAIVWVWVFNRPLSSNKWMAVLLCTVGCSLNCLDSETLTFSAMDPVTGLVVLTAFLSASAGVINERAIKSEAASKLSLDTVNALLYAQTVSFLFVSCIVLAVRHRAFDAAALRAIFGEVTWGALAIICVQIALGLSVSRVLKYADSVSKTVVACLREFATVAVAPFLIRNSRTDFDAFASAAIVGIAGLIYFVPTAPEQLLKSSK